MEKFKHIIIGLSQDYSTIRLPGQISILNSKSYEITYRSASRRVPFVVAVCPRKHSGEGSEKETEGPRDYHIVVEVNVECYQDHRVPNTFT